MNRIVAILSSTVINVSGEYDVRVGIPFADVEGVKGVTHYVGHPDTRAVVESLGAEYAGKGARFEGLEVGEAFMAFPLSNPNRDSGWTKDEALDSVEQLRVTLVRRTG